MAGRRHWVGLAWILAVWIFASPWAMAAISDDLPGEIPVNALPVDTWQGRVLLASPEGLWQLEAMSGAWQVVKAWRTGHELPAQFFGLARYLPDGSIAAVAGSQLLRFMEDGEARVWLDLPPRRHVHHLWVAPDGDLRLVYQPTPTSPDVLLQHWQVDWQTDGEIPELRHELHWSSASTVSDGCLDGAGNLWLATTGGLMQLSQEGQLTRWGAGRSHAVACGREGMLDLPSGGELVELDRAWRGMSQGAPIPRLGQPIQAQRLDCRDDGEGVGAVLFSSGRLAWWRRDAAGNLLAGGLWGAVEGAPESISKILWEPSTGNLLMESHVRGLQALPPPEFLGCE